MGVVQGQFNKGATLRRQQGVSLSGLILVLAVIGMIAVLAMKVFPTFVEYRAIKNSIAAAKTGGTTVMEVRQSFDKNADINMISSISGKDLIISMERGTPEVAFEYEKRIPLFANVTLLIDYSGTTDKTGVIPDKTETPR